MSWIRQAAEYIVKVLSGRRTTQPDYSAIGKDLHAKLIAKHGTQYTKAIGHASPGEYPRRDTGLLQSSLQTTIYQDGGKVLVKQRVNASTILNAMAKPFNYPAKLYDRGYLGPNDNLREEGLNVIDSDNFSGPSGDFPIYFDKSGA